MKKTSIVCMTLCVIMAFCAVGLIGCVSVAASSASSGSGDANATSNVQGPTVSVNVNLNFRGWYPWGGLQATPNGNTVTFNGKADTAGYVSEQLSRDLRGKTVRLEIPNAAASTFSGERLIKITVNKDDRLVQPKNVPDLIEMEYIPSGYRSVEFDIPNDFDGKLGFVFYGADLKGLQITAYHN